MNLGIAIAAFFKCLFDRKFAGQVRELGLAGKEKVASISKGQEISEVAKSDKKIPLAGEWDVGQSAALQLLGELQKNGRLLDFLEEDLSRYKDEEIGASVRPIHEGCRAVINKIFTCQPIVVQSEDSRIRINENYNAQEIKLCGRVTDKYPLRGTIVHPGWKATKVSMAERPAHLQGVIVPAEVEIE